MRYLNMPSVLQARIFSTSMYAIQLQHSLGCCVVSHAVEHAV
jgi:hypothetical protein